MRFKVCRCSNEQSIAAAAAGLLLADAAGSLWYDRMMFAKVAQQAVSDMRYNRVMAAACGATHNWHTLIYIRAAWSVEDLVWMWIGRACGNVICHHYHNVLLGDATTPQDLVCLHS